MKKFSRKIFFVFLETYKSGLSTLIISLLSMIFSGLVPLLTTWIISQIVKILAGNNFTHDKSIFLMLLLLLIAALNFYIANVKSTICNITGLKLTHNIENLVAEKFQKISQNKIDNPLFLDLYENTLEKSTYEPLNIFEALFNIFSSFFSILGYFLIFIKFDIWFTVALLVFAFPSFYLKIKLNKSYHEFLKNSTMNNRQTWYYFSLMTEPKYAKEVRLFDLFNYFKLKRKRLFNKFLNGNYQYAKKEIFYLTFCVLLAFGTIGLSEFYLLKSTITGIMNISDFVFYAPSIISFETSILSLIALIASNNRSMLFLDHLFEFLELPEEQNSFVKTTKLSIPQNDFTIEFKNVSFKYPGNENFALKDINIKINFRKTFCLVGENGSGKSTFINLLLRIYTPQKGEILLNGINIEKYNIDSYRKLFGVTLQSYINYSLNVKNCIGLGNVENVDDLEKIKLTAQKTHSDDFIKTYKKQYYTNLGKDFYVDGIEPSGGQWQKLAISRALYSDAVILVLDEPTAALDPKAEDEIFKIFAEISKDKILIIVSHRMYSARLADKIILFDKGKIIANGSHIELMQVSKKYKQMFNLQANKYK